MNEEPKCLLFSYGTLCLENVQMANFGRRLEGEADSVIGYTLATIAIDDPETVTLSGLAEHQIMDVGRDGTEEVAGMVFRISASELASADAYEVADYARVEVTLRSGRRAWAYMRSGPVAVSSGSAAG